MAFHVSMSKGDLVAWLKTKGVEPDDCEKLQTNNINGQAFSKLQTEDLNELGVSFGAKILLKNIIAEVHETRSDDGDKETPPAPLQVPEKAEPPEQSSLKKFGTWFKRRAEDVFKRKRDAQQEKSPKWVPYCTEPVSIDQPDSSNVNGAKPQGVAGAWVQTTKMWGRRDVLFIHFLNPEVLQEWEVGDAAMNIDNILSWAEAWNNTLVPDIPTFEKTDSARKADIRVNFGGDDGCWSKIGTDAKTVVDKTKPTMNLVLNGLDPDFQKYLVIHEFGHSLGLEHEHQRSDFWSVLKDFVDLDKMKADPQLRTVNLDVDMFVKQDGGESSPYDPDSVMHYWFDVNWLKDTKYRTLKGVESDNNLTPEQKKILEGIHKRNLSFTVDGPSRTDLSFLDQCYERTCRSAGGPPPPFGADSTTTPTTISEVNSESSIDQAFDLAEDTIKTLRGNEGLLSKWIETGKHLIEDGPSEDPTVHATDDN